MNKRIDDLIIKRNISKNEITNVKKSQISTDETEDIRSATTDETEEERDNSTKINKPLREISKPYRVSIRGKILSG